MKPVIKQNLSSTEYHADKAFMSSTDAKRLCSSSGVLEWLKPENNDRDAFRFGTAAHSLILEEIAPLVCPFDSFRSKAAQQWKADHAGENYVTGSEWEQLQGMQAAILSSPNATRLIPHRVEGGRPEVSIFWQDAETGACLKCRPDFLHYPGSLDECAVIVDYKTCQDPTPAGFRWTVAKLGYDIQAAWYMRGISAAFPDAPPPVFWFVAQEKTEPYRVGIYRLSDNDIQSGNDAMDYAISLWLEVKDLSEAGRVKLQNDLLYSDELTIPTSRLRLSTNQDTETLLPTPF